MDGITGLKLSCDISLALVLCCIILTLKSLLSLKSGSQTLGFREGLLSSFPVLKVEAVRRGKGGLVGGPQCSMNDLYCSWLLSWRQYQV